MRKRFTKKFAAFAGAILLVLGIGAAAYAYFTSTGNGTGNATVGSASNWSVAQTGHSGTLYPCGSTTFESGCAANQETLTFTVTNNSSGAQLLTYANLQTAIDNDGSGNIVSGGSNTQPNSSAYPTSGSTGGSAVSGCLSTWFGSQITSLQGGTTNLDVAGNGTATVIVTVSLKDASANQNPCQAATPNVDLWVG